MKTIEQLDILKALVGAHAEEYNAVSGAMDSVLRNVISVNKLMIDIAEKTTENSQS